MNTAFNPSKEYLDWIKNKIYFRGPQSVIMVVTPVHKSAQCKEQGEGISAPQLQILFSPYFLLLTPFTFFIHLYSHLNLYS